jgi:hypothetical protein
VAALALCFAALGAPAGGSAAAVWTAPASEKIRPHEAPRSSPRASIAAARNEFEAFQVVVTGPARVESATASDLVGAGTITDVRLFREELHDLWRPSALDGGTGRYPDALVPDVDDVVGERRSAFPFDVAVGESRALWVEVLVPADAAAGDYHGTVGVRVNGEDVAVPVHLAVWDFALPSTPSLKSAFGLGGGVTRRHGVAGRAAVSALRARYAQLALDHRISIHNVAADMASPMDWVHFDAYYGPLLDGAAPTRLRAAHLTSTSTGDPSSLVVNAEWAAHFRSRGWFGRLFQYTCDEPPLTCAWSDIPVRAGTAKDADPELRTLLTANVDDATSQGVAGAIDVLVTLVNEMDDRTRDDYGLLPGGPIRPHYDAFLAERGKELWLYQSCMSDGCGGTIDIGNALAPPPYFIGWPSYMIDASSVRARAMEWLSFRYGASGELYYETIQAYYARDPWVGGVWDFDGNGDGTLFYPGTPARIGGATEIPVASIRLKMIREGMEDFEYLKLLSRLGDEEGAQRIALELFPHPYRTDVSVDDLMAARATVASRILERLRDPASASLVVPADRASSGSTAAPTPSAGASGGAAGCGTGSTERAGGSATLLLVPAALALRRRLGHPTASRT